MMTGRRHRQSHTYLSGFDSTLSVRCGLLDTPWIWAVART